MAFGSFEDDDEEGPSIFRFGVVARLGISQTLAWRSTEDFRVASGIRGVGSGVHQVFRLPVNSDSRFRTKIVRHLATFKNSGP